MEQKYRLEDDTIVGVSPRDISLAEEFIDYELFMLMAFTLNPGLRDAMACASVRSPSEDQFKKFSRTILFVSMVVEKYGQVYEEFFDDSYINTPYHTFRFYEKDGVIVDEFSKRGATCHEWSITNESVERFTTYLMSATRVEYVPPQQVVEMDDISTALTDSPTFHVGVKELEKCVNPCGLCDLLTRDFKVPYGQVVESVWRYPTCCNIVITPLTGFTLLSRIVEKTPWRLLHYGRNFRLRQNSITEPRPNDVSDARTMNVHRDIAELLNQLAIM